MNKLLSLGAALCAATLLAASGVALAKLAAPTPEAKAKADEAKAKSAWTDKVGAFQLCQIQDKVAAKYAKTAASGALPATATPPPCADPGPYVPMAAASVPPSAAASAPPLEAAGAHSPTKTATAPPSGKATAAEQQGSPKK